MYSLSKSDRVRMSIRSTFRPALSRYSCSFSGVIELETGRSGFGSDGDGAADDGRIEGVPFMASVGVMAGCGRVLPGNGDAE